MRLGVLFINVIAACLLGGCCQRWQQPQPVRPGSVRGWKTYKIGTLKGIGEFVLNERESTQSDTLGIEIVEISPLVTCLTSVEEPPKKTVRVKLYKPEDKTILCETTIIEGSGLSPCPNVIKLPFVSVSAINTKDRWIHLSLDEVEAPNGQE